MKNKIILILSVIFVFTLSFIIKDKFLNKEHIKNNKNAKKEEKQIVKKIDNNKLYATLINYKKEDYSYETKKNHSNLSYNQEIIENTHIINNLDNDGLKDIKSKEKISDEKHVKIMDEEINKETQIEYVGEELLEIENILIDDVDKNDIQILMEDKELECDKKEQVKEEDINLEEIMIPDSEEIKNEEVFNQNEIVKEDSMIDKEQQINDKKSGFIKEDNITYYYEDDIKVTGIKNINGVNHYFNSIGKYLGTNNIKVIDVSYYQGDINWDLFSKESDCYGVILRLGYYDTLDKKFERNINELKRLNIPYGIYLFSYSTTINGSNKEANFTNNMIDKYDLKPILGIYYDIESWSSSNGVSSNNITKGMYDNIISNYINKVSVHVNNEFKVKVYSGRWYAMNRLGSLSKSYVDWVAEYNSTCKYDGNYSLWQYTSKGSVAGINGNVDISYIINN